MKGYNSLFMKYNRTYLSKIIRKNIKKYRLKNGYSIKDLASKTGFTYGYVRDLERFSLDKMPTIITLGKFANVFDIKIKNLFEEN